MPSSDLDQIMSLNKKNKKIRVTPELSSSNRNNQYLVKKDKRK